jgi:hypothetical protein
MSVSIGKFDRISRAFWRSAGDLVEFGLAEFLFGVFGLLRVFGGFLLVVAHVDLLGIRLAGFGE